MENANNIANEQAREDVITVINGDQQNTTEVSEEFSLPDYVPEVRRVLTVRAQVLPESKYLSDSSLEFGGTVTYSVIYTDDMGNLCALPLSSSYESKMMVSSDTDDTSIVTSVESCGVRVMGPRKLTAKSKLKNRVITRAKAEIGEKITPKSSADELYIERKTESINTLSVKNYALQNIRISEKLDGAGNEDSKPIWCDATVSLTDVKSQSGLVNVRGEINVKCLCVGEGTEVVLTKTIPLSEMVEAEESQSGDMVKGDARIVSLAISNEEKNEKNELFLDMNLEIECEVARNGESMITKDAYSTKYEANSTYKSLDYYTAIKEGNGSFTVSEGIKRKDKDLCEIITIIADPVYEKSEIKGTKVNHVGKLLLTILGKGAPNETGKTEFICQSYEMPIKYETEVGKISKGAISGCVFSPGNMTARLDEDNLLVNGEIFTSYFVCDKNTTQLLDTCTLKKDSEIKRDNASVRVCFPKENETLWDVAKKYKISLNKLKEQNDIDEDVLNKKCLII